MGWRDALLLCSPQGLDNVSFLRNSVCPHVVSRRGAEGDSGEGWADLVLDAAAELI